MSKEILSSKLLRYSYKKYFLYRKSVNNIDFSKRISSWDLCYNYFNKTKNIDKNLAGLHLGFYLASYGMLRGSSEFLNAGIKIFENLAELLMNNKDAGFTEQYNSIKEFLQKNKISPTQTLITKIMLGVYANTPAIDTYFNNTAKKYCKGIYEGDDSNKVLETIEKIFETKIDNDKSIEKFIEEDLPKSNLSKFKILDGIFFQIGELQSKKDN